jgi:hypothetical protein
MPAIAYLMPFGVGQFANDDRAKGAVVAVLQGIGIALNVGGWLGVEALKRGGSNNIAAADAGRGRPAPGPVVDGDRPVLGDLGLQRRRRVRVSAAARVHQARLGVHRPERAPPERAIGGRRAALGSRTDGRRPGPQRLVLGLRSALRVAGARDARGHDAA